MRRLGGRRAVVAGISLAALMGLIAAATVLRGRGETVDAATIPDPVATVEPAPTTTSRVTTTTTVPWFEPIEFDLAPVERFVELPVVHLSHSGEPDPAWDRIHYEVGHEPWGPGPAAVDDDGTVWIPDNAARRIVRIDRAGQPLEPVELPGWEDMGGIQALVVDGADLYVLDTANTIIRLSGSGALLDRHPVPIDLTLVGGLPAILSGPLHLDDQGRLVIDAFNRFLSFDPRDGTFDRADELVAHGTRFGPGPPAIRIQGRRVGRVEPGRVSYGGRLVGISPDGFVVVIGARTVERPDGTPEWQEWLWRFHRDDERAGAHQLDPDGRFLNLLHPAALGPDGRIYVVTPRAESVVVTVIG